MKEKTEIETAPAASAPNPAAEERARWLAEVQVIARRAFHDDARLIDDALAKAGADAVRSAMLAVEPRQRFAALCSTVKNREHTAEELAAAKALAARRIVVRDALAAAMAKRPAESWDELWYRAIESRVVLAALGRLLHRLGALRWLPEGVDP